MGLKGIVGPNYPSPRLLSQTRRKHGKLQFQKKVKRKGKKRLAALPLQKISSFITNGREFHPQRLPLISQKKERISFLITSLPFLALKEEKAEANGTAVAPVCFILSAANFYGKMGVGLSVYLLD